MLNHEITLEVRPVGDNPAPSRPTEEARVIAAVIALVEHRGEHVVHRVRLSLLHGLIRPSYAVRLKLFLPFLRWLLAEATSAPEIPTTEADQ